MGFFVYGTGVFLCVAGWGGGFPDGVGLAKGWDLEIGTLFFSKAVAISCV